jgi:phosphoribosyl 1,2-cyclic phosphate 1,2-diphosphodiesterase
MKADLHIHSLYSDGSASIKSLLLLAKNYGLDCVSITDHDTVAGTEEALALGHELGITVIPGIEISAYDFEAGRKVHILGYGYGKNPEAIKALCDPILFRRDKNSRKKIARLSEAGYCISVEEVEAIAGKGRVIYKQHIMRALIERGYADDIYSPLYYSLFKGTGLCAGDIEYSDVFDALHAVIADGGFAVLAHPGELDSWNLVDKLVEKGLSGIELYHGSHCSRDHRRVLNFKRKYPHLVLTGGTDDHGAYGSMHRLGEICAPHSFQGFGSTKAQGMTALARGIVRDAGAFLKRTMMETLRKEIKNNDWHDLVTDADRSVEQLLVEQLREITPGARFITEEDPESASDLEEPTWIIDPIDGTVNFIDSKKDFTISVAFYEKGLPVLGVVYDVMADTLYSAERGKGAFCNGVAIKTLSNGKKLHDAVIDTSLNTVLKLRKKYGITFEEIMPMIRAHRSLGCASLAICRIACGKLDCYVSAGLHIWDFAAARIVLDECGGAFVESETESAATIRSPHLAIAAASASIAEAVRSFISMNSKQNTHPIFKKIPSIDNQLLTRIG